MQCQDIERDLVLYASDELDDAAKAAVEEHLRGCSACRAALEQERQWLAEVAKHELRDPSPALLARCRGRLSDALDEAEEANPWKRWVEQFRPASWFTLHPAGSAALLVLLGVALGSLIPQWVRQRIAPTARSPRVEETALTDEDLRTMDIAGINWTPGGDHQTPNVEVRLSAERPFVVSGSPRDSDVKRVLMFVVENNQRFDPGVRLDSLEVLRTQGNDAQVRQALCFAARNDRNPGVRLKALEALRGLEQDENVRRTLLDALLEDKNPGVRIEAVNALRAMAEKTSAVRDVRVEKVLKELMRTDPNTYIRLQSAAAIRRFESGAE